MELHCFALVAFAQAGRKAHCDTVATYEVLRMRMRTRYIRRAHFFCTYTDTPTRTHASTHTHTRAHTHTRTQSYSRAKGSLLFSCNKHATRHGGKEKQKQGDCTSNCMYTKCCGGNTSDAGQPLKGNCAAPFILVDYRSSLVALCWQCCLTATAKS